MKIVVAGKGGAGKTTVSGTIARALARAGNPVLALDADANPMLGVSLGVGYEQTDRLNSVRQALDAGDVEHEPTVEGMVENFGTDAPDGVRLVVASRIDNDSPGCQCCGVSPDQILRELEHAYRVVICDLEAGIGTLTRMAPGNADAIVVVANPTAKSIEVARRAVAIADDLGEVVVLANRVRDDEDLKAITDVLGEEREMVIIPEDPIIAAADRDGTAPIDLDPSSPGVAAIIKLADRLAGAPVPA
ncbi:MAG: AAA family ATPase [Thermoleophilaceae bacterium]